MPLADYRLRVDWEGQGTYGGSADVTARTLGVSWQRGRDFASQLIGRSVAGRFAAQINNESGDYSSFNASSPLNGSLLPGRLVQVEGTAGGTSYILWTGYLQRIVPKPDAKGINSASLEAIGPSGFLNQRKVDMPMVTNMLTGTAMGTILDNAGWGTARSLDAGRTTMTRFWASREPTINALRLVEETEGGFVAEAKGGSILFEDRYHRLASPHTASQATFTDNPSGTLFYTGIEQEDPLPGIFNIMEAEVQLFAVGSLATLWTLAESGTDSPLVEKDQSKSYWAQYPTPDSPTDAVGVDAWTVPAGTTDYTASATAGTGTELTASFAATATRYGNSMLVTMTNNGTSDGYLTKLQARGTPVTKLDPVKVSAEDGTSQSVYGERTYPSPARFIPDTGEAQDWCDWNLGIYKSPIPIVAISFVANRNAAHMTQALSRDISDRITIVGTGSAGLGVAEDFFIEAEHHRVDSHRTHTVTWECSQAARYSDAWVLDVSALGTSTRLTY